MKEKVTINDIAKLAGVSKTTVSFYLNGRFNKMSDQTREKIEKVISRTNYVPNAMARTLNFKQSHLIGVIIGDITSSFSNQIVKGLNDYARERNYQLILGSSDYMVSSEKQYLQGMINMGVDGFVVQPTVSFEKLWEDAGSDKPLVLFDSPTPEFQGLYVKTNNYEALYEASSLIVEKGYRNCLIVTGDPNAWITRADRVRGFEASLENHGIPYHVVITDQKATVDEIRDLMAPYIEELPDLCIFASSNWLLTKVHLALEPYRDRIPEDLGLIGMDAVDWAALVSPSITTVVQPAYEEGQAAGKIVIDRIEGKNEVAPSQVLKCTIRELESTAKQKRS